MLRNYLKIAIRHLAQNKIYSFINIAGLTIGLTCAMLILLYVKDEVSFDRFHQKSDHIYRIVSSIAVDGAMHHNSNTGLLQGPRFSQNVSGIKSFVRVQDGRADFKKGADVESSDLLFVDPNFFSVFTFPLLEGDASSCLKNPHTVVLTKNEAQQRFGTWHAVGKILLLKENNQFVPYQVTGVTENCPENSTIAFKILLPFREKADDLNNRENWFAYYLNTFVELEDKADPNVVSQQMQRFYIKDASAAQQAMNARFGNPNGSRLETYSLQPFLQIHLSKELSAQNGLQKPATRCMLIFFPVSRFLYCSLRPSIL